MQRRRVLPLRHGCNLLEEQSLLGCVRHDLFTMERSARSRHAALLACARFVTSLLVLIWVTQCATATWPHQLQVGPFRLHADFPLKPWRPLFDELAALQIEVQHQLHVGPGVEAIDVYLFAHRDNYRQYMRYYFPGVGVREAMFVKSNSPGNVFAYAGPNLAVDLRHEGTHAILHSMLPMVPLWLDEGLAEYYEVPVTQRAFENPYLATVRRNARIRRVPSIRRLEALGDLSEMGPKEYRDAWAWVHFMIHGPEQAQLALLEYFDDLEHHRPPAALSQRLALKLGDPSRGFQAHFRKWTR
jgi:hypothetical protein